MGKNFECDKYQKREEVSREKYEASFVHVYL